MKGFIQIPILIAILISAVVFGGGGYLIAEKISRSPQVEETAVTQVTQVSEPVATTTEATSTAKPSGVKKQESVTKTQPPVAAENFNATLVLAFENGISHFGKLREYIESLIALVDNRIELLDTLINRTERAKSQTTDSQSRAIHQVFLDGYRADRSGAISTKESLNSLLTSINTLINYSSNHILELRGVSISRERLVAEAKDLTLGYEGASLNFDGAKMVYQGFKERADRWDATYTDLWDKLADYYGSQISQLEKASYVPPPVYVPTYNPPRFTTCVVDSYQGGGSLNCSTY